VTGRSVLVVDDDQEVRETLVDALSDEGYHVLSAANGREALTKQPGLPRPFAVVLDIIMPVMNGREFYDAMRSDPRFLTIPVLVSTSDPTRAPTGVSILRKPIDLHQLISVVGSFFMAGGPPGASPGEVDRPPGPPDPVDLAEGQSSRAEVTCRRARRETHVTPIWVRPGVQRRVGVVADRGELLLCAGVTAPN
jgi:two-component system, chemotaxis family, chemotaxis protein CheY